MSAIDSLSIVNLILEADLIVKLVLIILFISSIFSWSVVCNKIMQIKKQRENIETFEQLLSAGNNLEKLYSQFKNNTENIIASIFVAGFGEFQQLCGHNVELDKNNIKDTKESILNAMSTLYSKKIQTLESKVDWLATIASSAPFVGLLGTVWGIMNSFKSIAVAKNTSLAIVAPSIAEALFATAVGLLVAIPAVIFYNAVSNNLNNLSTNLEQFIKDFHLILIKNISKKIQ